MNNYYSVSDVIDLYGVNRYTLYWKNNKHGSIGYRYTTFVTLLHIKKNWTVSQTSIHLAYVVMAIAV